LKTRFAGFENSEDDMHPENEWDQIRNPGTSLLAGAGIGILRIALLFGSVAVALALIVALLADNYTKARIADAISPGLDMTRTGSIGPRGSYTIRKSVLQPSPDSVCVIRANGTRSGDC
jgi:hypothetical protein